MWGWKWIIIRTSVNRLLTAGNGKLAFKRLNTTACSTVRSRPYERWTVEFTKKHPQILMRNYRHTLDDGRRPAVRSNYDKLLHGLVNYFQRSETCWFSGSPNSEFVHFPSLIIKTFQTRELAASDAASRDGILKESLATFCAECRTTGETFELSMRGSASRA